jgi:hypothetical protein
VTTSSSKTTEESQVKKQEGLSIGTHNLARAQLQQAVPGLDHRYGLHTRRCADYYQHKKLKIKDTDSNSSGGTGHAWMPEANWSVHSGGSWKSKKKKGEFVHRNKGYCDRGVNSTSM